MATKRKKKEKSTSGTPETRQFTLRSLSLVAVIGTILVVVVFALLRWRWNADEVVGISDSRGGVVMASYLPLVGGTLVGYRNYLFGGVQLAGTKPNKEIRIKAGAGLLLAALMLGFLIAITVLLVISEIRVQESTARLLTGVGATAWSGSIGYVFDRFVKMYADAEFPTPSANADSQAS